ncbi:MAG: ABC transporter substrate-binding protein, partial [Planctomycetaceae bacterium]
MRAATFARPRPAALGPVALAAALALATGCRRAATTPVLPPAEPTAGTTPVAPQEPDAVTPPSTRAALERLANWIDRPVRDALALEREREAREPPPCTVDEAFASDDDSPAANARIVAALFRPAAAPAALAGGRANRHLVADVASLNPLRAETAGEFDVAGLTGLTLFGFDRDLETFANADAVRRWRSSADGLVDVVELRDDLAWSDGAPVTAHDVAFTWRLAADPRVPARAFRDGARRLRDVRAYDDRTVAFFHESPPANARDLDFPLLPRHVYASTWEADPSLASSAAHAALERRPVTGGPYEVAARTPAREIVLRRRPAWATVRGRTVRAAPPFAEIRFRVVEEPSAALEAVAAGGLDEAVLAPDQWPQAGSGILAGRAVRVRTPEWRSLQFAWNLDTPWFEDRRVRRAMGWAFDHARLLDALCHGLAEAGGGFPPHSRPSAARRVEPRRQDLDKAEALLDESGWVDHDGDGVRDREIDGRRVPFEFTVVCDRHPCDVATCALLRECLARVGVTCVVRAVESAALHDELRAGRCDACLVTWGAAADPDAAASLWSTSGSRNHLGYSNPEIDRLFAEGRRERDRDARARIRGRIQEILAEDEPCTWIAWRPELRCVSRRLGGGAA